MTEDSFQYKILDYIICVFFFLRNNSDQVVWVTNYSS